MYCHSVSLGGGALNMVTEYSETGEGRGCLVAYTTPCFPNFSHFPPLPTTLQLWKDVWHIFEVDLGSALLCGHLFSFLISFPDPKSQLTSKGLRTAQWEELGWDNQISIVFLKGIYLEFLLKETYIVFKQSFSCFPGQIWIYYCNTHYVDNFFCAVLAQWKAGCGRSCLHLHFRPRHVPVNYSSKTLPWVRLAAWLCTGGEQNSKQLKSYSFVKSWKGNDSDWCLP